MEIVEVMMPLPAYNAERGFFCEAEKMAKQVKIVHAPSSYDGFPFVYYRSCIYYLAD